MDLSSMNLSEMTWNPLKLKAYLITLLKINIKMQEGKQLKEPLVERNASSIEPINTFSWHDLSFTVPYKPTEKQKEGAEGMPGYDQIDF